MGNTYFSSWGQALSASLQGVWFRISGFLPNLLGALIVLIIGLLVAEAIGRLVRTILGYTRVDAAGNRLGLKDDLKQFGLSGSISGFVGAVVKWFLIVVTFLAVVDILGINQLSLFLQSVLLYIPQVIIAIVILGVGIVGGRLLEKVIDRATTGRASSVARTLGAFAKWAIIIFALMAALVQLGIAASLVQILFTGLVIMFAIAGGLAFGLGGRDKAREWLNRVDQGVRKNVPPTPL